MIKTILFKADNGILVPIVIICQWLAQMKHVPSCIPYLQVHKYSLWHCVQAYHTVDPSFCFQSGMRPIISLVRDRIKWITRAEGQLTVRTIAQTAARNSRAQVTRCVSYKPMIWHGFVIQLTSKSFANSHSDMSDMRQITIEIRKYIHIVWSLC